jgi:hypothetical protein
VKEPFQHEITLDLASGLTPLRIEILTFVQHKGAVNASDVARNLIRGRNKRAAKAQLIALHRLGLLTPIRSCEYTLSAAGRARLATPTSDPKKISEPKRRQFLVSLVVFIDLDQRLLDDVLTEEWRAQFYGDVRTASDVANHLAFNLVQGRGLSSLDGFADQPDDRAVVVDAEVDAPAIEASADPTPMSRTKARKARGCG